MNNGPKIILYLLITAAILYFGYWLSIIAIFSEERRFYIPLLFISGIIVLILIFITMFGVLKPRRIKLLWLTCIVLPVVSCSIYHTQRAYDKSILRIREGGVDLTRYAPFEKNTDAVSLDGAASLKITTDIPRMDGATALYPLYAAFAQAVYPERNYNLYQSEVACNNTIHAYQSLIQREADIIFVAPPSEKQLEAAEKTGVTFRLTPIGKEAFVFFVNVINPVDNLTTGQLQGIYSGEITNWKEIGGKDQAIRPFQRNENSGSQTAFQYFMKGKTIIDPPKEDVVEFMGGIISRTADYANYSNAIGFSFRFYTQEMVRNKGIKLLKINGIYPDPESIYNNSYPLASPFYAVTLSDNIQPNVQKLLDWILSSQGQYLVEKTGYCPLMKQ